MIVKFSGKALLGVSLFTLAACGGGGGGGTGAPPIVSETAIVQGSGSAPLLGDEVTITGAIDTSAGFVSFTVTGGANFSIEDSTPTGGVYSQGGNSVRVITPGDDIGQQWVRYLQFDLAGGDQIFSLVGTRPGSSIMSAAAAEVGTGNLIYTGDGTAQGTYWNGNTANAFSGGNVTVTVNLSESDADVLMNAFSGGVINSIEIQNMTINGSSFEGGTITVDATSLLDLNGVPLDITGGGLYGFPRFEADIDGGPDNQPSIIAAPPEVGGFYLVQDGDITVHGLYAAD